eukprot:9161366-Pyramimonas_sp.AAC.1
MGSPFRWAWTGLQCESPMTSATCRETARGGGGPGRPPPRRGSSGQRRRCGREQRRNNSGDQSLGTHAIHHRHCFYASAAWCRPFSRWTGRSRT